MRCAYMARYWFVMGAVERPCVFCQIVAGEVGARVVHADDAVVVFLDARPVFKGHVLVVPRQHVVTLPDLDPADVGPFFERVQRVAAAMPHALDADGTFVRELKYAGLPCSLDIGRQYIYMVNGFAGQILQMDLNGKVLAATGKPGTGPGEFGEAHFIAVSPKGELYVADSINSALLKFVKK